GHDRPVLVEHPRHDEPSRSEDSEGDRARGQSDLAVHPVPPLDRLFLDHSRVAAGSGWRDFTCAKIRGGAFSKYLKSAGHSQPSMPSALLAYQFPSYSSRCQTNSCWYPGNGAAEKRMVIPDSASGIASTILSIIVSAPATNGSCTRPTSDRRRPTRPYAC